MPWELFFETLALFALLLFLLFEPNLPAIIAQRGARPVRYGLPRLFRPRTWPPSD